MKPYQFYAEVKGFSAQFWGKMVQWVMESSGCGFALVGDYIEEDGSHTEMVFAF